MFFKKNVLLKLSIKSILAHLLSHSCTLTQTVLSSGTVILMEMRIIGWHNGHNKVFNTVYANYFIFKCCISSFKAIAIYYIYTQYIHSFIHSSLVTPLSSAGLQVRSGASPVTLGTRQENTPWTGCTHASKP